MDVERTSNKVTPVFSAVSHITLRFLESERRAKKLRGAVDEAERVNREQRLRNKGFSQDFLDCFSEAGLIRLEVNYRQRKKIAGAAVERL